MAGRKRKPKKLHMLHGTLRGDRHNLDEPEPEPNIPDPPPHLKGYALEEWERIVPELYELGLLSNIDRAALAAYCQAYRQHVEAVEAMEQKGSGRKRAKPLTVITRTTNGNVIQSPLVGIANTALFLMHKYLTEFGLTPVARTRAKAKKPEKPKSQWEKFGAKK